MPFLALPPSSAVAFSLLAEEDELKPATDIVMTVLAVVGALVVAFVLGTVISGVVRRVGRRSWFVGDVSRRMRRPLRAVLMVVAVWVAVRVVTDASVAWRPAVEHLMLIACIVVGSWFVGALAFVIEDSALHRFRTDVADNRHARRVRTQITVVRRLTVALVVVCAIAAVLLTFPAARAAGASLLASAGLISIVAGLAAQTSLANVFAGMQIAFTDAIRVDDVVVLEGEWGRIEEITMTYVVVHLWDDRRLIMPCTYFTTNPFQNWTRRAAELLGTVEIDLDWDVPVPAMRAELKRLLEASPLWDHRVGILQVTDATGGYVRVRALASAADAGTLFDLRCYVREGLVDWLRRVAPEGVPRTRFTQRVADPALSAHAADAPARADGAAPAGTGGAEPGGSGASPADGPVADVTSPAAQPSLPQRIPVRAARPGLRMHLAEPARGVHSRDDQTSLVAPVPATSAAGSVPADAPGGASVPAGAADETTVLPGVPAVDETMIWATGEGLFTGSAEAVERSRAFAGPGQDVIDERERTALSGAVETWDEDADEEAAADDDGPGSPSGDGAEGVRSAGRGTLDATDSEPRDDGPTDPGSVADESPEVAPTTRPGQPARTETDAEPGTGRAPVRTSAVRATSGHVRSRDARSRDARTRDASEVPDDVLGRTTRLPRVTDEDDNPQG